MQSDERIASDLSQTIKRVDDMTLRLALVEKEVQRFDEKISDVKLLIVEKVNDLREDTVKSQANMQKSIDHWNRLGFWLLTVVAGWLVVQVLLLIQAAA